MRVAGRMPAGNGADDDGGDGGSLQLLLRMRLGFLWLEARAFAVEAVAERRNVAAVAAVVGILVGSCCTCWCRCRH